MLTCFPCSAMAQTASKASRSKTASLISSKNHHTDTESACSSADNVSDSNSSDISAENKKNKRVQYWTRTDADYFRHVFGEEYSTYSEAELLKKEQEAKSKSSNAKKDWGHIPDAGELLRHFKNHKSSKFRMPRNLKEARMFYKFANNLGFYPRCSSNFKYGSKCVSRTDSLTHTHLQHNNTNNKMFIVLDIDRKFDFEKLKEERWGLVPVPNMIVKNPKNGHCHLYFMLGTPVVVCEKGRIAPIKLLERVYFGLVDLFKADIAYSGLLSKNPFHAKWDTEFIHTNTFELRDFSRWCDTSEKKRRKMKYKSAVRKDLDYYVEHMDEFPGRNCYIQRNLVRFGSKVAQEHDLAIMRTMMTDKLRELNDFTKIGLPSLEYSELKHILKHCIQYCTKMKMEGKLSQPQKGRDNYVDFHKFQEENPEGFVYYQKRANLSSQWETYRKLIATYRRLEPFLEIYAKGGKTYQEIADLTGCSVPTICRYYKYYKNGGISAIRKPLGYEEFLEKCGKTDTLERYRARKATSLLKKEQQHREQQARDLSQVKTVEQEEEEERARNPLPPAVLLHTGQRKYSALENAEIEQHIAKYVSPTPFRHFQTLMPKVTKTIPEAFDYVTRERSAYHLQGAALNRYAVFKEKEKAIFKAINLQERDREAYAKYVAFMEEKRVAMGHEFKLSLNSVLRDKDAPKKFVFEPVEVSLQYAHMFRMMGINLYQLALYSLCYENGLTHVPCYDFIAMQSTTRDFVLGYGRDQTWFDRKHPHYSVYRHNSDVIWARYVKMSNVIRGARAAAKLQSAKNKRERAERRKSLDYMMTSFIHCTNPLAAARAYKFNMRRLIDAIPDYIAPLQERLKPYPTRKSIGENKEYDLFRIRDIVDSLLLLKQQYEDEQQQKKEIARTRAREAYRIKKEERQRRKEIPEATEHLVLCA